MKSESISDRKTDSVVEMLNDLTAALPNISARLGKPLRNIIDLKLYASSSDYQRKNYCTLTIDRIVFATSDYNNFLKACDLQQEIEDIRNEVKEVIDG